MDDNCLNQYAACRWVGENSCALADSSACNPSPSNHSHCASGHCNASYNAESNHYCCSDEDITNNCKSSQEICAFNDGSCARKDNAECTDTGVSTSTQCLSKICSSTGEQLYLKPHCCSEDDFQLKCGRDISNCVWNNGSCAVKDYQSCTAAGTVCASNYCRPDYELSSNDSHCCSQSDIDQNCNGSALNCEYDNGSCATTDGAPCAEDDNCLSGNCDNTTSTCL